MLLLIDSDASDMFGLLLVDPIYREISGFGAVCVVPRGIMGAPYGLRKSARISGAR